MAQPISLPPVTGATLPADVRKGSEADKSTYRSALAFEKVMIGELLKNAPGLQGGEETPAAYKEMIPSTLADSLANQGGIGLAHDLYLQMRTNR